MQKVHADFVSLEGEHLDRLIADKRVIDFTRNRFVEGCIAHYRPEWTAKGIAPSMQVEVENLLRTVLPANFASATSLVFQFVTPTEDGIQLNPKALKAVYEESESIRAGYLAAAALTAAAARPPASNPAPASSNVAAPTADSPRAGQCDPIVTDVESVVMDVGCQPILDICKKFVALQVQKDRLTEAQSQEMLPKFYGAMLTIATTMHATAQKAISDNRFRELFGRMVDELNGKVGFSSADVEFAARNVH